MTDKKEIKLGNTVSDLATGVQGYATSYVEQMNGNVLYQIQVKAKDDGSMPESYLFDKNGVRYVDEGIVEILVTPPTDVQVKLGDKVKDKVSGFEGVATERMTYLNGCVHFLITGPINKEGKPTLLSFLHERLTVVKTAAPSEAPKSRTGGPPMRAGSILRG